MQAKNVRDGITRAMNAATPRDVESVDRLVHGSLILGALALADLVDKRFKWIAYGAAGVVASSAFTSWTPASALLALAGMKTRSQLEHERHGLSCEESDACTKNELHLMSDRESGASDDDGTSSRGIPHRIPVEALFAHYEIRTDEDDLPAPSVDGDLGLAD